MEFMQNWGSSRLADYLRFDYWENFSASCLLAGFDYVAHSYNRDYSDLGVSDTLDVTPFLGGDDDQHDINVRIREMQIMAGRLQKLWEHTNHGEGVSSDQYNSYYSPSYYIEWALCKGIRPEWLDWAIKKELFTPKSNTEKTLQPEFDKTNLTYPPELDMALQAWRKVSATEGKGKPKARIRTWLNNVNDSLPKEMKLSKDAIERIAIVANWDKTGGATRSD